MIRLAQHTYQNPSGVSMTAVIVFVLLIFSVVLANGIVIQANARARTIAASVFSRGVEEAKSFCGITYSQDLPSCIVSTVVKCGDHFLLASSCEDLDPVLLNMRGEVVGQCGTQGVLSDAQCAQTVTPFNIAECFQGKSLCL